MSSQALPLTPRAPFDGCVDGGAGGPLEEGSAVRHLRRSTAGLPSAPHPQTDDTEDRRRLDMLASYLAAASHGDAVAFALLYEAVAPRAYGLVLRILNDVHQAEEVTQEVFLQLWLTAAHFDPNRGSAVAWVMTLAHRRAVDRVRGSEASRRRDAVYAVRSTNTPYDTTAETVDLSLDADRVRAALAALSPAQQEAIELAYFHGHTYHEVSRLTRVPLGTAKGRIRDAMIALRGKLSTRLPEPVRR